MPSPWFGLDIGLRGLTAAQTALDTVAHNVANANTEGYSRQRVNLVEAMPYTVPAFNRVGVGQLGTGVTIQSVDRARDAFLDFQIRGQGALSGYWDAKRDELARVQSTFAEPSDNGIGTVLSRFWSAWQDLAADPTSTASRASLVEASSTLAALFNSTAGQLQSTANGYDGAINQYVRDANDLAARIASLNGQIQAVVVSGDHANDLEDQRDLAIAQLNAILPMTAVRQADGSVTVTVGGVDLVNHNTARTIVESQDANGHVVPAWSTGAAVELGTGKLSAYTELRDVQVPAYIDQINQLAKGLADAVNAVHVSGVDATGAPGLPFFTYVAGNEASTIAVNAAIVADPRRVAAASAPNQPGDASIAGRIAELSTAKLCASGTQTATDFYAGVIGKIGSDTRQADENATNQSIVLDQLQRRRESVSGVSLDEEATDMLRFQHAYSAASRVITAVDEMLDQLINHTGLVGR